MNKKSAHFGLSLTFFIAFLAGCATGDFSWTRPVAAPPVVYDRDEVSYENHWLNGINFVSATAGDMNVAAAMWPDQPRALIVLVNGSNEPVTFLPQEVMAEAIQTDTNETQRSFLGTYSAEEYEKAENIPLLKKGGVYEIPIEMNGVITLNFVLDTGASEVNIPADVALTLYRAGTIKDADFLPGQTYRLADGSQVNSSRFVLRSLKIGQRRITNVAASIGSVSSPLLLGQSFLEKLGSWGINNKKNVLTINPDTTLRAIHASDSTPISPVPQISSSPPIAPIVGVWRQYFYDAYGKLVYGGTYRVIKQKENYVMHEEKQMKASKYPTKSFLTQC